MHTHGTRVVQRAMLTGALQEGGRSRVGECGGGDGICRTCNGTGYVRVQPQWMRDAIASSTPPPYKMPGPLMTTPQKPGPLIVPGTLPYTPSTRIKVTQLGALE